MRSGTALAWGGAMIHRALPMLLFGFAFYSGCAPDSSLEEVSPHSQEARLVDAWSLDGHARNSVRDQNNVVHGATVSAGIVNGALRFDGDNDYVALETVYRAPISQVSVCAWVLIQGRGGEVMGGVLSTGSFVDFDRDGYFSLYLAGANGTLAFSTQARRRHDLVGKAVIADGQWHHVCGVYDGMDKRIFVDGELDGQAFDAHLGRPLGRRVVRFGFLGVRSTARTFEGLHQESSLDGLLDDVRLYHGTLGEDEIQEIRRLALKNDSKMPIETGEVTVNECQQLNGIEDPCYWRYRADPAACKDGGCSRLVVIFSGGEMNCDDSFGRPDAVYSKAMAGYVEAGYVAVCAGVFLTNREASQVPYYEERDRIDLILSSIRASKEMASLWDGQHLLLAGVSHGATAPVVVMARSDAEDEPIWHGEKTTAACFHDGTYDVVETDAFLRASPLSCGRVRQAVVCDRYYGGAKACEAATLEHPDAANDTIVDVPASAYGIKDWKIIECGSATPLPACGLLDVDRDWLPASSMEALCTQIDSAKTHTCQFDSLPDDGHLSCLGSQEGIAKCRDWFNALTEN